MNGFTKLACAALIAGVGVFGGEVKAQTYYSTPVYAPATNYGYTAPCTTGNCWGQTVTKPITTTTNWLGQVVSPLFGGTSYNQSYNQSYYRPVSTGYATQPQTICGPNGCYVPATTTNCPGGVCPTPNYQGYSTPNYQGYSTPSYQGYSTPSYQTTPAYYNQPVGSYYGTGATVPVNYQTTGASNPFYK